MITIEPSTALTAAAWVATSLLAVIALTLGGLAWFFRREIKGNDDAHKRLEDRIDTVDADVKKVLEGNIAWVKMLLSRRQ